MRKNIAVIRGDGIGPEVTQQAVRVLEKTAQLYDHDFAFTDVEMGGAAFDRWGDPLPDHMLEKALTVFCSAPSADRGGMRCRLTFARRKVF